jgi:PAS domain S-box-containing protein
MSKASIDRHPSTTAAFAELAAFSRQLNSSLRLETVCEVLADGVQDLLEADRCAVFLLDQATDLLHCVLGRGLTREYTAAVEAMYQQLPGGQLLQERFMIVDDARSDERMAPVRLLVERNGFVSMLLVGFYLQEQAIGAFGAYYDAPRRFDESILALAQTLANQAAMAIADARSYLFIGQRVAELEKLRQAAVEINGQPDLESTLGVITRRAADLLASQGTYIYLRDAERNELVVRSVYNAPGSHLGRRMRVGEGLAGRVFLARQAKIVGDYRTWTLASDVWQDVTFGTVLAVPLLYGDEPIGVLTFVDDAKDREFDDESMRVAGLFASLAAAALTSALFLAESHRRANRLTALQRVTASVTAALDLKSVLQSVVEDLRNTFGYALTSIYRVEREYLVLEAIAGVGTERLVGLKMSHGRGIIGRAVRSASAQFVADVTKDVDFVAVLPGIIAEAVAPIVLDGRVWGVLNVESAEQGVLSASDVPLLSMFCQQISVAIRNASNFAEIEQRVAELEGLRRTSLRLALSLDTEDLLQAIAACVVELAHPRAMHLHLYDQDKEQFTLGVVLPDPSAASRETGRFHPDVIMAGSIRSRRPIIVDDATSHPLYGANPDPEMRTGDVRSIAAFPLLRPSGVMGIITVSYDQPTQISGALERLLSLFADQAAVALENARLYELEARRRQLADTLRQLASAVNSMMDFEQAATTILEYLARVVALDSASLLVVEEDHFRIAAHVVGEGVTWTDTTVFRLGELVSSERVFTTGEPLMIPDTAQSDIWRHDVGRRGIGSWLGFPISFQGEPSGVLSVDRNRPGSFSLAEIQIVKAFADQAATGLANAKLFQAVTQRSQENERLREFNEDLLRGLETGILLEGADDTIRYVNPRLCEIVGHDEPELVGRPAAVLLSSEMSALVDRRAARRRLGEKGRYEASLLHRAGHEVPVLVNATPVFESGVYAGTLTAFTDITQRKRTERTLLALNAAAAAVRHATEPHQVVETIAAEVRKLGFSLASFTYKAADQQLLLEHLSLAGQLEHVWALLDHQSLSAVPSIALHDLSDFQQPLLTGQAGFIAAPAQASSLVLMEQAGISAQLMRSALEKQRAILAPLVSQQQVIGVFVVLGEDLSEDDLPAFEAFANQASAALDNARLLAAERRERERAETLAKIASILNSTPDLDDALPQVMRQLRSFLPFDNSALFLVSDGAMVCRAAEGTRAGWWLTKNLPLDDFPLFQEMIANQETILVSDCRSDPRWRCSPASSHLASWIGAPLVAEGQLVGLLSVDKAQPGFFAVENRDVMTAFADQLSVAVQRAHHSRDAQQRLGELASLAQVSALLTEAPDLEAVLEVVLGSVCQLLGAERGAIALTREPSDQLYIAAARGHALGFAERANRAGLSAPPDLERGPDLRPGILIDPDAPAAPPDQRLTSAALVLGGQVVGLIEVEQSSLDAGQRRLLAAVADLAAVAIDKAQLYQDTVRAYEELRDLDRLKDEFVQNVSHELRTPLTFVKGYVEYLLEGYAGQLNDGQQQALEIVLDRSNAIIRLVNDIVSLKQAELQEMDLQPVALELIAVACVEGSRVAAEQAGIQLQLEIPTGLPEVYGNSKRLGQVFDNLLGNAIKFSPDGGVIRVRLRPHGGCVEAEVSDTGIGMPPDRLDHIWKRFYQLDSASTRRFPGAGLGLAIVKRIIDAHDGEIWVESELNKGSTFHFTLPIYTEDGDE